MEKYQIAIGKHCTSAQWENKAVTWSALTAKMGKVLRTQESAADYASMSKPDKSAAKDHGGFVGGALRENGPRRVNTMASRSLITLDIDSATADTLPVIEDMLDGSAWCVYSTHGHTPEKPRLRLVVPLSREVAPEEYGPIARRVGQWIDIDSIDPASFSVNQLMYWPSCPADGEFVFKVGDGKPLDADKVLASYVNWKDWNEWPVSTSQKKLAGLPTKALEDPTEKKGVVGVFCRHYGIQAAIATFLSDIYEPSGDNRYTFKAGTSANGVVVYDDKWAYSHHATDPAGEKNCNAFDLVRIHKFGQLDDEVSADTPVNRVPSYKAMSDFAASIPAVGLELTRSFISAESDFVGETGTSEEKSDDAWLALLQLDDKTHKPLPSPHNFRVICENDPRLKGTAKYDIFRERKVLQRDLPWAKVTTDHKYWCDTDDFGLVDYISGCYRLGGKQAIVDSHELVVSRTAFHPVRDYLDTLEWDGEPRLDSLFIDYLNADDDKDGITRAMTRKALTAAVARIYRPGTKFDYILTLTGPEGIGKSTLLRNLGMSWFNDSFSANDLGGKDAMEQLIGTWIVEIAELSTYKKNDVASFKHFLTKCDDIFRQAYARQKSYLERQCIFFATTNEAHFLKGDTGNRRFWIVQTRDWDDMPLKDVFGMTQRDIDQIWAEAKYRYEQGEALYLGALEKIARQRQEAYNEIESDERVGIIEAYLKTPLPSDWEKKTLSQRADYFRDYREPDLEGGHRREYICAAEVMNECLRVTNAKRNDTREINQILARFGFEYKGPLKVSDRAYGQQRRYQISPKFYE